MLYTVVEIWQSASDTGEGQFIELSVPFLTRQEAATYASYSQADKAYVASVLLEEEDQ